MFDSYSMSITSIEHLSNEFFYEMFDYLDGYDIHKAFSNLTYRFQALLNSSSLLFKIHLHSTSNEELINDYKQILLLYNHQMIAIDSWFPSQNNDFFLSLCFDSSFDRLESLSLREITPTILRSLHTNLTNLPRLFSLTIDTESTFKDLSDVYQFIFALLKLKYAKCSADDYSDIPVSLPMTTNEQLSTIEHLIIDHSCTFNELFSILSYTPELCHFKFKHTSSDDSTIETIPDITLPNLTYMSMYVHYVRFDELELFLSSLDCPLKVLHVTTLSEDMNYFDDDRWEEFILEYVPELEEFYFQYYEQLDHESDYRTYFNNPDRFTGSFWIERNWVLEAEMDAFEIVYSIRPYKKRWYDVNSSIELSKSTRFTLTHLPRDENFLLLMMNIRDMLAVVTIYHLELPLENIFSGTLIDILYKLPKIDSLKIRSLSVSPISDSSDEGKALRIISNKNHLIKVCLEKMNEIEDIYFLIKLCPRMNYLQVDCINNIDLESFVQDILRKINTECNQYLRSMGIHISTADDKMVQKLDQMIHSKNLLVHYSIKRVSDHIYLQWK